MPEHSRTSRCKRTLSRRCHKCPRSAPPAPAARGGTGKTGAGKGEKNKGLWKKAERSIQREEEEKQSESLIPRYLEEP